MFSFPGTDCTPGELRTVSAASAETQSVRRSGACHTGRYRDRVFRAAAHHTGDSAVEVSDWRRKEKRSQTVGWHV